MTITMTMMKYHHNMARRPLTFFASSAVAAVTSGATTDVLRLVAATDPITYVTVALLMLGTALMAPWLPARAPTRIDPADTLRREG